MIKKISIIALTLLMSFGLLEGLSRLSAKEDCKTSSQIQVVDNNVCPYTYQPYKNIKFDFFSKHISTDFDIDSTTAEYAIIEDIEVPTEPSEKIITKEEKASKPKIAFVIDDMGIAKQRSNDIISLNAPITLSFLTYTKYLDEYIKNLKGTKFEVIAHIPMEAKTKFDEAPDTLRVTDTDYHVKIAFNKMLDKFSNIKWVNNHTGSLFTEDVHKMNVIMKALKEKNIGFLDSKTSPKSVGKQAAKTYGVKYLSRNVFLDNKNDFDYIMGQIKQAESIAKKYGSAIVIGHPKSMTYEVLKHWLSTQTEFEVVTLSNI